MDRQFRCKSEGRRKAVKDHDTLNGIDYLEVWDDPTIQDRMRQRTLFIYFVKPLASKLTKENVSVEGGVRICNVGVKDVERKTPEALKVDLYERGDFSNYTLRLVKVAPNDLFSGSETLTFIPSGSDPALAELGLQSPTQVKGVLSSALSGFTGLTNDPAKIEVEIGSEGQHNVEISGQPSDLDAARIALEAGIQGAHSRASFKGARVLRVDDHLLILPGTVGDAVKFSPSRDDPAIRELGLEIPTQVKGILSSDLSGFAGLTKAHAHIKVRIASEDSYHEIEISDKPPDLNAAGAELEAGIRTAYESAPFRGGRVVKVDNQLLVLPGIEQFDPALSAIQFSFKAGCPSEFDCKTETICPTERLTEPEIDYLAKDYGSFRRLMLDRMSVIMPDWKERNPADLQIALVELLAYVGDHLSYFQDAVATEAYLGTARQRVSVRRHARLLDYFIHDGCNARAWVYLEVKKGGGAEGQKLPAGMKLMTRGSEDNVEVASSNINKALNKEPVIFETMHDITLYSSHNEISFYTWSDSDCCLPRGSTRATLYNDPALFLRPGDLLIFEEVKSQTTGKEADPRHRHAVRLKSVEATVDQLTNVPVMEIEWHEEDALPFPLSLTAIVTPSNSNPEFKEISVARGNVVLADHGQTLDKQNLVPSAAPDDGDYRPKLQHTNITIAVPYDDNLAKLKAAAGLLDQDPHKGLPWVKLYKDEEKWRVQRDLMGSDRFATEFVVEIEKDGTAQIRFGDGVKGKKPPIGFEPTATYRIGNGREGNIGAETICCIVSDFDGIDRVRNPLPVSGGRNAETMEEVRQFAPHAFRTQGRAVTEADYAKMVQLHPEVQKARATFRWTGSWHTVFIAVDRKGGWERDKEKEFKEKIRLHLEKYRLAGYDLEISNPVFVPLDILMEVCVKPGYLGSNVKESLLRIFSRYDLDSGQRGFFHPDNFTFGQPVYLSQIYKNAMEVAGIASAEVVRFQRWGKKANHEIEYGMLAPADFEIVRLDNDPNFPENGRIAFEMYGGL